MSVSMKPAGRRRPGALMGELDADSVGQRPFRRFRGTTPPSLAASTGAKARHMLSVPK
jgi:hypothetical protein